MQYVANEDGSLVLVNLTTPAPAWKGVMEGISLLIDHLKCMGLNLALPHHDSLSMHDNHLQPRLA